MSLPDVVEELGGRVAELSPTCGKERAQQLENEMFAIAARLPESLLVYEGHPEPYVREAIAVVAGRLYRPHEPDGENLGALLDRLSSDENKWVRIKAERALSGGLADAEQMSPLANCCISVHNAVRASKDNVRKLADDLEAAFKRKVSRRRPVRSRPFVISADPKQMAQSDITDIERFFAIMMGAPNEVWDTEIDHSPGWKGDELFVLNHRRFSPLIASFAVWPRRGKSVYVCGVWCHDDWPDDFAVWYQSYDSPQHARTAIETLDQASDYRNKPDTSWTEVVRWA